MSKFSTHKHVDYYASKDIESIDYGDFDAIASQSPATGRVFVDAKDLQSTAFKVITENSVVFLMGRVTSREAQRATDIARSVGGVTKVVRVFDIITEEELKRLSAQTSSK